MHNYVNVLFKWPPTAFSWGTLQQHHYCLIKKYIKIYKNLHLLCVDPVQTHQMINAIWSSSYIKCVEQAPRSLGLSKTHSHIAVNPFWEETLVQSLWTCISLMQAGVFCFFHWQQWHLKFQGACMAVEGRSNVVLKMHARLQISLPIRFLSLLH